MDNSQQDSDVSMSPMQLLERLQLLRQLQLLQRGKLQKHRLQYENSPETSQSITEIVSHFTNSTSYNTFRSLLNSSQDEIDGASPRVPNEVSRKLKENDLIDGVSVLNLSQESEQIVNSPLPSNSNITPPASNIVSMMKLKSNHGKKCIELDEMPILSPRKDFEELLMEKLKDDTKSKEELHPKINNIPQESKKPFLRRGEGMMRFGLKKNDLIIQNTNSLPWKSKESKSNSIQKTNHLKVADAQAGPRQTSTSNVQIVVSKLKSPKTKQKTPKILINDEIVTKDQNKQNNVKTKCDAHSNEITESNSCSVSDNNVQRTEMRTSGKHPLMSNKGKTWAAVLSKEQDAFLRQLKQSEYYKNFSSPAKSITSDISCDENLVKLQQEREKIEQNMFELLENKVSNESFSLESSFFNKFLRKSHLECSGESTPLVLQKCLKTNPDLFYIGPKMKEKRNCEDVHCDTETCTSEYTDCDHETCSSVSTCCSCNTVEETPKNQRKSINKDAGQNIDTKKLKNKETQNEKGKCQEDIEKEAMRAEMAEMNAKLVATSELLKDRLKELEDEIETFRKENSVLTKMKEEVDMERHKFYEEKSAMEQRYNEEKILTEYHLAEEKEQLAKQKQLYERYVREIRGRLNKKEKDEVVNLKKEISDLKEEIRNKDAKSTCSIARLRNQLKIMEKEKKALQDEVEKLKKENRRLHHSNDMTRRMTNIKYLEQINKKLSSMTTRETLSEVNIDRDIKYKAYEIERQSRSRKVQPVNQRTVRPRAKSVPNLKVTSRYAKYFSQRDVISQMEPQPYDNDDEDSDYETNKGLDLDDSNSMLEQDNVELSDEEAVNNLEKIYEKRFKSVSPRNSGASSLQSVSMNSLNDKSPQLTENANGYFLRKSHTNSSLNRNSKSPIERSKSPQMTSQTNRSKSPISILSNKSHLSDKGRSNEYVDNVNVIINNKRSRSPLSAMANSSSSHRSLSNVDSDTSSNSIPINRTTSATKTSLNPTEIKRPDGTRELRFPNGNIKYISQDGKYTKFVYYNGDIKESFLNEGRIKYYYSESKTYHSTYPDGLEILEFPDGQVEKRYKDGSSEIRLPNGSVRYNDPKNRHVREEWRFPDGTMMSVSADGDKRVQFPNGQVEVHSKDHKRREFPDGTVKLVYNDGTAETRYSSGRVRIKDKHGNLIMDSAPG